MSKNDYITGEELRAIISFAKENGYTIEEAIDIYKKEAAIANGGKGHGQK